MLPKTSLLLGKPKTTQSPFEYFWPLYFLDWHCESRWYMPGVKASIKACFSVNEKKL